MKRALLLAHKDLRMLLRTRALLALLVIYPLVVVLLSGSVLLRQGPPKIAFVNEDTNAKPVKIGDTTISIDTYLKQAEKNGVDLQQTDRETAERALDEGQVAGVIIVPRGTMSQLATQLSGVDIVFETGDNPLGNVVAQRMRGVIYNINLNISKALIDENAAYLDTLVTGGRVDVNGDEYDLYGLSPIEDDLRDARDQIKDIKDVDQDLLDRIDRAIEFANDAGKAIGLADNALEATAAPIRLEHQRTKGKSPLLTSKAMGLGLATLISFLCVVMVGNLLAAERDDAVLGRLLRGLARPWQVVVGKLLVGAVLGGIFSLVVFLLLAVIAPQAWARLPLLFATVTVASVAASSIGALIAVLVRDARTATLAGILVVLPLIPLAFFDDGVVGAIQQVFPVAPSWAMFNAVLFDAHPVGAVARGCLHLLAIAVVAGTAATRLVRRLA